jgi:hypothetical protein
MASQLEIKKIKAELLRVQAGYADADLRVEDHLENIERLKASMAASKAREEELAKQLSELK